MSPGNILILGLKGQRSNVKVMRHDKNCRRWSWLSREYWLHLVIVLSLRKRLQSIVMTEYVIFWVFLCFMFYCLVLRPCYVLSHLRCPNLDLTWLIDLLIDSFHYIYLFSSTRFFPFCCLCPAEEFAVIWRETRLIFDFSTNKIYK